MANPRFVNGIGKKEIRNIQVLMWNVQVSARNIVQISPVKLGWGLKR